MKKIIDLLLVLIVLMMGIGGGFLYREGMGYVDYALRRGNSKDPWGPPQAFEEIYPYPNKDPQNQPNAPLAPTEIWTLQSFDGLQLVGSHFLPEGESHRWVILVHGYGCNERFMWGVAPYYLKRGYHVVTPNMRASGKSEGTYLTMGVLEGKDVAQWAREITAVDPKARIVLHGESMGASDVMMALGEPLPKNVKAVIEDSGYSDLPRLLEERMEDLDIPYPSAIIEGANLLMKIRTGVFLRDVSPIKEVKKSTLPILFIHGSRDELIPPHMMNDLAAQSPSPIKEELLIKGGRHAENDTLGDVYFRQIFRFLEEAGL